MASRMRVNGLAIDATDEGVVSITGNPKNVYVNGKRAVDGKYPEAWVALICVSGAIIGALLGYCFGKLSACFSIPLV